eukprot:633350-Rhodomonas_salina.2
MRVPAYQWCYQLRCQLRHLLYLLRDTATPMRRTSDAIKASTNRPDMQPRPLGISLPVMLSAMLSAMLSSKIYSTLCAMLYATLSATIFCYAPAVLSKRVPTGACHCSSLLYQRCYQIRDHPRYLHYLLRYLLHYLLRNLIHYVLHYLLRTSDAIEARPNRVLPLQFADMQPLLLGRREVDLVVTSQQCINFLASVPDSA